MNKAIKATGSKFAEALLEFKGNKIAFGSKYEAQRMVYDLYSQFLVLKAGRQVGKSLGLAGRMNVGSIAQKYFTSLYTAPSQTQAKRFSSGYLDPFRESKYINKHFIRSSDPGNIFEKHYSNKSKIYVSYAQSEMDSDRIRGMTADLWCGDEVQDMSMKAIPIIKEILNTSEFGYQIFAGTAKSSANTLERLWLETNQMEYVKKCESCSKWVIPDNFELMMEMCTNENYMVCPYCKKEFSFNGGHWVAANNALSTGKGAKYGMHLPQLIFGANTRTGSRQWDDLYDKVNQSINGTLYTPETIANEVFGLSTDLGATSLGISEAMRCCFDDYPGWANPDKSNIQPSFLPVINAIHTTVLGVDWSVSGSEGSHTVVSVIGVDYNDRQILLYSEKLRGSHILTQVEQVLEIARRYNCQMIGSDRGVGVLQGELMQQKFGLLNVIMCQYVSSAKRIRWNRDGNFLAADRTAAMDDMMHKMRLGPDKFITPKWEFSKDFWDDALSIYEEETRVGNRIYCKQPSVPDDWFHSVVFANLAYKFLTGEARHLDEDDG